MATKRISLPAELESWVDAKIASGDYATATEVVQAGIRLMMRKDAKKLEWLRNAIARGEADAAAGRVLTPRQVRAELAKRMADRRAGSAQKRRS